MHHSSTDLVKAGFHEIASRPLARIFLGAILMFACAQMQIPLKPVPITLQTSGALLLALIYDRKDAMSSMTFYLLCGAVGLPVFSGFSSGLGILIGPRAGYLFGMLLSVYLVTSLRKRFDEDSITKLTLYCIAGSASVFALGIPVLSYHIGFKQAIDVGLLPFILPGLIKACFVAAMVKLIKSARSTK